MSLYDINHTFDGIERIDKAKTPEELISELAKIAAQFGFTATAIAAFPHPEIPFEKRVLAHHWPNGWFEHYMARNYITDDPVFHHSKTALHPFEWAEASYEKNSKAAQVMNEAAEFGFAAGLCVPTLTRFGPINIAFGGERCELSRKDRNMLHLVAVYAQICATEMLSEKLRTAAAWPLLSQREREVLHWCAAGKTSSEIAAQLGISEHTVLTHIANAGRKLGAPNRTAAVARAMSAGLISLTP
jgi:LuxR family quorum sensing-dependent transcriptional regulator